MVLDNFIYTELNSRQIKDISKCYVYGSVDGTSNYKMIKLSDLLVQTNPGSRPIKSGNDFFNELKKKNIYLNEGGKIVNFNKFVINPSCPHIYSQTDVNEVTYTEQEFRRIDKKAKLETRNYSVTTSGEGDFIAVLLPGRNLETLVSLNENIYIETPGKSIELSQKFSSIPKEYRKSELESMVGKRLVVKLEDGTFVRSEPLTQDQASLTYTEKSIMQPAQEDQAMQDGVYLKLKNGQYIQEKDAIKPECYIYQNDDATDFDAYLAVMETPSGNECFIVNKNEIAPGDTTKKIGEYLIDVKNQTFKIKKSYGSINSCDVIKTSNVDADVYHSCQVLRIPNREEDLTTITKTDVDNKDAKIASALKTFTSNYLQDKYTINTVDIDKDGSRQTVRIEEGHNRYVKKSDILLEDVANQSAEYNKIKSNPATYKNGKLIGGAKYDFKAGLKQSLLTAGKINLRLVGYSVLIGWPLLLTPAAVVLPIIMGAAATSLVIAPIVEAVKTLVKNNQRYKYKDKTKTNRKRVKKSISAELENVHQLANKLTKDNTLDNDAKICIFTSKMQSIEHLAMTLGETKYFSGFEMKNGVGDVNQGNAVEFSNYRDYMRDLKHRINKTKALVRRKKATQEDLTLLQDEYKAKKQNYVSSGRITTLDPQQSNIIDGVNLYKGYVIAKNFKGLTGLTAEEKQLLEFGDIIKDVNANCNSELKEKKRKLDPVEKQKKKDLLNSKNYKAHRQAFIEKLISLGKNSVYDYDEAVPYSEEVEVENVDELIEDLSLEDELGAESTADVDTTMESESTTESIADAETIADDLITFTDEETAYEDAVTAEMVVDGDGIYDVGTVFTLDDSLEDVLGAEPTADVDTTMVSESTTEPVAPTKRKSKSTTLKKIVTHEDGSVEYVSIIRDMRATPANIEKLGDLIMQLRQLDDIDDRAELEKDIEAKIKSWKKLKNTKYKSQIEKLSQMWDAYKEFAAEEALDTLLD